jgi:hypothetical protein
MVYYSLDAGEIAVKYWYVKRPGEVSQTESGGGACTTQATGTRSLVAVTGGDEWFTEQPNL